VPVDRPIRCANPVKAFSSQTPPLCSTDWDGPFRAAKNGGGDGFSKSAQRSEV